MPSSIAADRSSCRTAALSSGARLLGCSWPILNQVRDASRDEHSTSVHILGQREQHVDITRASRSPLGAEHRLSVKHRHAGLRSRDPYHQQVITLTPAVHDRGVKIARAPIRSRPSPPRRNANSMCSWSTRPRPRIRASSAANLNRYLHAPRRSPRLSDPHRPGRIAHSSRSARAARGVQSRHDDRPGESPADQARRTPAASLIIETSDS